MLDNCLCISVMQLRLCKAYNIIPLSTISLKNMIKSWYSITISRVWYIRKWWINRKTRKVIQSTYPFKWNSKIFYEAIIYILHSQLHHIDNDKLQNKKTKLRTKQITGSSQLSKFQSKITFTSLVQKFNLYLFYLHIYTLRLSEVNITVQLTFGEKFFSCSFFSLMNVMALFEWSETIHSCKWKKISNDSE